MKFILLFLSTVHILFASSIELTMNEKTYLQQKSMIKICVNPSALPYEGIDEKVKYQGIGSDVIKIISKTIDKPIILVPTTSWTESLEYFDSKKCDVLPLVINTPRRQLHMNLTKPYIRESVVVATKLDKFFINDSTELSNNKIGVI